MYLKKYLTPFVSHNIFLFFVFSVTVNEINNFFFINLIFYALFHLTIIYLGIYYYRKTLYLLYFIYGLILDLLWLNQIGPHLIVFMIMLLLFNLMKKNYYNLNSQKVYVIILVIQLIVIFLEMFFSQLLFNYNFNINIYLKLVFISFVISFPLFYFFYKIDNFK